MVTSGYAMQPVAVKDLKAVTEDVVYRAPGKSEIEIRKAIVAAAREFLKRTGVWKEQRNCQHVKDSWFAFRHGYLHAQVVRVDSFTQGECMRRMAVDLDGVAPIPCGIPLPRIGNPSAPSLAAFIEQGGYVMVSAPGAGLPPLIPVPYQQEENTIPPIMAGEYEGGEGLAVFTLTIAFGGEMMPEPLIQQYGAIIADGAAHILLTGPNVARTAYGDRFTNACDTLAMRMSHGGAQEPVSGTIFDGMVEV